MVAFFKSSFVNIITVSICLERICWYNILPPFCLKNFSFSFSNFFIWHWISRADIQTMRRTKPIEVPKSRLLPTSSVQHYSWQLGTFNRRKEKKIHNNLYFSSFRLFMVRGITVHYYYFIILLFSHSFEPNLNYCTEKR